jgi:hypothetical protein
MFRLFESRVTSPRWFRDRCGQEPTVVNEDARSVTLDGEVLVFEKSAQSLPPGTPVVVSVGRWFICRTQAEVDEEQHEVTERQERERQEERDRRNHARKIAEEINSGIKLPVPWTPGTKDVLSGLSLSSCGNGRNRRTVQHVLLQADLNLARLKRRAGDFLCSSSSNQNGKRYTDSQEFFLDGEGQKYPAPVTCKSCLRVAASMANRT